MSEERKSYPGPPNVKLKPQRSGNAIVFNQPDWLIPPRPNYPPRQEELMMTDVDQAIWTQLRDLETGVYAPTPAFTDADGHREFYGEPSEFVPAIRRAVIDALIADTAWMDAWARDQRQQERMSQTRLTITDWLESHK